MATPAFNPNAAYSIPAFDPSAGYQAVPAQQDSTPPDTRNGFQKWVDNQTRIDPADASPGVMGHVATAFGNIGGGLLSPLAIVAHPIRTGEMMVNSAVQAKSPGPIRVFQDVPSMQEALADGLATNPSGTIENAIGAAASGPVIEAAAAPVVSAVGDAASAVREAALGDPNAAALRGLHVSPQSKFAQPTLDAVQGARPFLQGVEGQADLQNRVPVAKQEIWQPYEDALNKIGYNKVKGPDGQMTTVQDLENRRLELSAQLRTLRKGGPEAVQLAQQKGLTQASLLREDSQIRSIIDPQFRSVGVDPVAIRKAFAQVSQVGGKVAGKTTIGENTQPTGFGRMTNIRLDNPRSWVGEPAQGVRDLIAGRPLWSANPTDMNLREAFRAGGPKPQFAIAPQPPTGAIYPTPASTAYQLPATSGAPTTLPYYPQMTGGENLAAILHYLRNTPAPLALPAEASPILLPPPR